jgi:hypothetical protein
VTPACTGEISGADLFVSSSNSTKRLIAFLKIPAIAYMCFRLGYEGYTITILLFTKGVELPKIIRKLQRLNIFRIIQDWPEIKNLPRKIIQSYESETGRGISDHFCRYA